MRTTYRIFISDGSDDIAKYLPGDNRSYDDFHRAGDAMNERFARNAAAGKPIEPMIILACDDGEYRLPTMDERLGPGPPPKIAYSTSTC